jgi:hypothetical protein
MNKTFKWCVNFLEMLAAKLSMTYEEINVWIFVIIQPIVFIIMLWVIYKQHVTIKALKQLMLTQ